VSTQRPLILLTGFGSFPGVESNATAALIPEIATVARQRFGDHEIVDEVLPVEWARAPHRLNELLERDGLRLALHFGVSKHASGFQLELMGHNVCGGGGDAAGEMPSTGEIIAGAPASLASTFPVEAILARLRAVGLPCAPSNSAGTYLCNALLYHSLTAAHGLQGPFLSGFVHLPVHLSATGSVGEAGADCLLTWDDAVAGGVAIIAACLEAETNA
jgi:pyroglutamyl-peptidase